MSNIIESLGIICEFSIGLAGFTGIMAIFANSREPISASFQFRIACLMFMAFTPGFLSLLVISFLHFDFGEMPSIRIGSIGFVVANLGFTTFTFRGRRQILSGPGQQLSELVFWFTIVTVWIITLFQAVNSLVSLEYSSGLFMAGLVGMLSLGALIFFRIVTQIMSGNAYDT
jgi:hypothetical protein